MGRFLALNLAGLMGLGLLSISSAQAQDAYGGTRFRHWGRGEHPSPKTVGRQEVRGCNQSKLSQAYG